MLCDRLGLIPLPVSLLANLLFQFICFIGRFFKTKSSPSFLACVRQERDKKWHKNEYPHEMKTRVDFGRLFLRREGFTSLSTDLGSEEGLLDL